MASTADWFTEPFVLHLGSTLSKLNSRDFYELCRLNPEARIELTARGDLVIMPPTGGQTGLRNARLTARLQNWAESDGSGLVFDSSTLFTLPNGACRSPDASWIRRFRWESLSPEERDQFPPLCPDFVVEIRSRTDRLSVLLEKMDEYVANGAQLGWLIDPLDRKVHLFVPGQPVRCLDDPASVSGDSLLPGFVLDLSSIW